MDKYKAWVMLILCNLFWAGNYVFGKFVVSELTPLLITFLRWFLACLLLFPVAHYMEKPKWKEIFKSWPLLTIMGILGIIVYNLALYWALNYTSSTNAALVSALNPAVIVVLTVILFREKISNIKIIGLIISLCGVFVILTEGKITQVFQLSYNKGDLIMFIAILAWGIYSILGRRLKDVPPISATAICALSSTLILSPFALHQGINVTELSKLAVIGILYMAVFSSVGSYVFWNISVKEVGASQAGVFLNLIPVFTAIISWSLGEKITMVQIIGGLFVFFGVYLTTGLLERRLENKKV